jgi:UDP-N-acetylmuramoyl-L-alanyl-D-glutamate--2,6-diaminopimelate ligase
MDLQELLADLLTVTVEGTDITGLALDSRRIKKGDAFLAFAGVSRHGLQYLPQALAQGAAAVIFDPAGYDGAEQLIKAITIPAIALDNLKVKLGELAGRFYDHPSHQLAVIGITGTNGKTSCSQFLAQVLDRCGIIGTLGWGRFQALLPTINTTPDAVALQAMMADMKKQNMVYTAMEVSSHGLDQGRVDGIRFKGAVVTNVSRDHLDYHGTMEAYLQSKLQLLVKPGVEFAVLNLDSAYSERIIEAVPEHVRIWGFTLTGKKLLRGETLAGVNLQHSRAGLTFDVCWGSLNVPVKVPLYGEFNAENSLSVLAVMLALDIPLEDAAKRMSRISPVPGRMQRLGAIDEPIIFIDYAHTPDALEKALLSLKKHSPKRLGVVFGCGGNRDKGKRPLMGACAEQWADHIILTDDNPRDENSADIIDEILAGCHSDKIEVIPDRKEAITATVRRATPEDWLLIAGKGHEDYQEIKGVRRPFNDAHVVHEALSRRRESLS